MSKQNLPDPLKLYIPPCVCEPAHPKHPPQPEMPLRVNISGPMTEIQKLVPGSDQSYNYDENIFPHSFGPVLAQLTFEALYGRKIDSERAGDFVVVNEHLGWTEKGHRGPVKYFDYYNVTFDHLIPAENQSNPDTLQINLIDTDEDNGEAANKCLMFQVDRINYIGKKVLAVPRCCQHRKGTTDRMRINTHVAERKFGWDFERVTGAE